MAADTELRAAGQADGWSGKRVEGVFVELQRVKKGGRVGPPRCGLSALFSFFSFFFSSGCVIGRHLCCPL